MASLTYRFQDPKLVYSREKYQNIIISLISAIYYFIFLQTNLFFQKVFLLIIFNEQPDKFFVNAFQVLVFDGNPLGAASYDAACDLQGFGLIG